MISHPVSTCACCGEPMSDEKSIDVRFGLPDAVFGTGEETRRHPAGIKALLEADGHGSFVRCLLPVRLTDGIELGIGTWLRIGDADLARAAQVWGSADYDGLVLRGTLANAVRPWDEVMLGAPVTVTVRSRDEIPYVTASDSEAVTRILTEEWHRDHVLSRFGHALPVAVRTRVDERWSVERTPGLAERVHEGRVRFVGPGRTVVIDPLTPRGPGQDLDALLAGLLEGGPSVPEDQQVTEREPGCLRHALWTSHTRGERVQYELYGFVVVPGAALVVTCVSDDPADLAWAKHVWRSVRVEESHESTS